MSNATIADFIPYATWRLSQIVDLLNTEVFETLAPMIVAHENLHDAQADCPDPTQFISEEIINTPHITTHALVHLKQMDAHINENFWEVLPMSTEEEYIERALAAVFGGARSALTLEDRRQIIVNTQNKHAQIRAEVEAEERELEAQKQREVLLDEPIAQEETIVFPTFSKIELKNAGRAKKDGYLVYVGAKVDCDAALARCKKGSVGINGTSGRSWRFVLPLTDLASLASTNRFNFKKFASEALQSCKAKQQPELPWYEVPSNPNPPNQHTAEDLELIATY